MGRQDTKNSKSRSGSKSSMLRMLDRKREQGWHICSSCEVHFRSGTTFLGGGSFRKCVNLLCAKTMEDEREKRESKEGKRSRVSEREREREGRGKEGLWSYALFVFCASSFSSLFFFAFCEMKTTKKTTKKTTMKTSQNGSCTLRA